MSVKKATVKSRQYYLLLNEAQANILVRALDAYSRVAMGQIRQVADTWIGRVSGEDADERLSRVRACLEEAERLLTGMPRGASLGMLSPDLPDEYRAAYDLQQVVRHRLAWDRQPEGGITVDFDEPRQTSAEPLAQMQETATRVYHLPGLTLTVTAEEAPGQDWDLPARRAGKRPTTLGMDQLLLDILTRDATAHLAPEDERAAGHRHLSCWAGAVTYVLSTYLRRYLGDAVVHNDPPECK